MGSDDGNQSTPPQPAQPQPTQSASAQPTAIPARQSRLRRPSHSPVLSTGAFAASPPAMPISSSYGSNFQRDGLPSMTPRARSARDYFGRPESPVSNVTDPRRAGASSQQRGKEWTVFGQLLEDDRTPGIRGADTPIHSIRRRTSRSPFTAARSPTRSIPPSNSPDSSYFPRPGPKNLFGTTPGPDPTEDVFFQDPLPLRRQSVVSDGYDLDHSDAASTATGASSSLRPQPKGLQYVWACLPNLTPLQRNILKCTLAYFIGSLFTYWPLLSNLISDIVPLNSTEGPSPSGHMVATVTVYFNPAKTIGAMIEADTYCLVAAVFSSVVCLLSFGLFWFFEEKPGMEAAANMSVFVVLGLAMTAVAWSKNWMERPSFNTACSMASIMIFIVVVREGGAELLIHVLFIVLVGSAITNFVCFSLWRQSAATNLQNNMAKTLDCFATLLDMTTQTFLLQENYHPNHGKLLRAVEEHQKSFTSLKNSLSEAKSEWCDPRMRATSQNLEGSGNDVYDAAVEGLTRIAQHLNGLRDGTRLQFELTAQERRGSPLNGDEDDEGAPGMIDDDVEDASALFQGFVDEVGPPLSALSGACISCLNHMCSSFQNDSSAMDPAAQDDFADMAKQIERALFTFERTSNQAVLRYFRKTHENEQIMTSPQKDMFALDQNESVFLIYFFIFTLQEFARELANVTEVMGTIKLAEAEAYRRSQQTWLGGVLCCLPLWYGASVEDPDVERRRSHAPLKTSPQKPLKTRLSTLFPSQKQGRKSPFPKIRPHAPNTIHTPPKSMLSLTGRLQQTFWKFGARLKQTDLKYAIKCGIATSMLASPALFEATRPLFLRFRGEWALISFFVVLSPTVGQTNWLSLGRILGTMLGATTAAAVYTLFPHNPYVLSIFGAFFSVPCFYYIVSKPQYATSGRFVLLTYNLTALFCFNSRSNTEIEIVGVALRRFTAVSVGVIWAIIVSRWWWPVEARRELTQGLSDFCLNLGWLYTTLVETYSVPPGALSRLANLAENDTTSHQKAVDQLTQSVHHFMAMELHLQISLIKLQSLLAQTQHEPRLKGPFPVHLYRTILTSLQVILDKLHSMRCVTTREEWYTTVRNDFIIPVNKERREMVGNVVLYFSTLASAFTLKRAMPPYLPPAEGARQRLVDAIRQLDVVKQRNVKQSHHLLYFAYALMMKGVIHELDFLGQTLQEAYGVIGQSVTHFEELFTERTEEQQAS